MIGLGRALAYSPSFSHIAKRRIYLEIMKMLVRTDTAKTHDKIVAIFRPFFDEALTSQYTMLRQHGCTLESWLKCHRGLAALLMDGDDLTAVMEETITYHNVAAPLSRLSASSRIGKEVFSFALSMLVGETYHNLINCYIKDIVHSEFDIGVIETKRTECEVKIKQMSSSSTILQKRDIVVEVAGMKSTMPISDARSEWEFRLAAAQKDDALGSKMGLTPLKYEEWLMSNLTGRRHEETNVPPAQLENMHRARTMAADILKNESITTLEGVSDALLKAGETLTELDRTFHIELQFLQKTAHEMLKEQVQESVLALLPTEENDVTLERAMASLSALATSEKVQFASIEAQGCVQSVRDVVAAMIDGISPTPNIIQGSAFYRSVLHQLQFFATTTPSDSASSGGCLVSKGKSAIDIEWAAMSTAMGTDGGDATVTLGNFEIFQRFKWLLSEEQKTILGRWVSEVVKKGASSSAMCAQKTSGVGQKKKGAEKNKVEKEQGHKASVAKFFG